ncbi:SRPBCC domain-containing protein [Acrocarpospora sp. B8E8]|uniref:SRPBCC domain-containing protein n=1 Tax=Acrocarpospora sp. B8E8 TaxID=3153572 RepID=UPI00325C6D87
MHTIDTGLIIKAAPAEVWAVIADFGSYAEWNPFILRAEGEAVEGSTLRLHIRPPGEKGMTHQPTVLIAEPARRLCWLGKVSVPGLFAARHEFILEPIDEGTRFRHREVFTGLLVPLLRRTLRRTETGFELLNQALKKRVEAKSAR